MSEISFSELLQESIHRIKIHPGALVQGRVIGVDSSHVVVNAGLKSEAVISIDQFKDSSGNIEVAVGDLVELAVEAMEDGFGETILSREKAKRLESWQNLLVAHEQSKTVVGMVTGKVKGGYTVEVQSVRAFLPGSLVDNRPGRDLTHLEGKELEFRVIKVDRKRNNVVVSRRFVDGESESELLSKLSEGQILTGVVKNLTDYGAFIDLGGIDGLLHITDISWKRVKHPSEILNIGSEVRVVVLKFDRERNRVSLGMKQLGDDPWVDVARRYSVGSRHAGKVTNLTDYGCFVELEPGIEGLVHVSEMDWTNKNVHPSKIVQLGQETDVMVLEVDESRRRVSLGIKQCAINPWKAFSEKHSKNEQITGKIKSITDFGLFIGLEGNIDGLVHLSDVSWNQSNEEIVKQFKKGQEVEAIILSIDPERERISLGIKQLEQDPLNKFSAEYARGSELKGKVSAVEDKLIKVDLPYQMTGQLSTEGLSSQPSVGEEISAWILSIDRKNRAVQLTQQPGAADAEPEEASSEG